MKKIYLFILMGLLSSTAMFGQFGNCSNARAIYNGFTESNITTAGTGVAPESWVTSFSSQCISISGTYYGSVFTTGGGDYLFSYTTGSLAGESISLTIRTHASFHGIAIFTDCNETAFDGCLAWKYNSSAATATLTANGLRANQTIYIAVGIWADPKNLNFSVTNFTVTPSNLDIADMDHKNSVLVYPNPVKDILYLDNITEKTDFTLIDVTGKIVKSGVMFYESSIDVSELNNGFYILNLISNKEKKSHKILKQ